MPAKNVIRRLLRYLVLLSAGYFSSAWPGLLVKQDLDNMFADQYIVGDIQPNMPLWPLFVKNPAEPEAKPELKAYVFETIDFEPVRGYGGKPIDVMVVSRLSCYQCAAAMVMDSPARSLRHAVSNLPSSL
jgi:transcriptional regulator of nitric oxide reductase